MVPRTRWTAATALAVTGTLLTIGLATPGRAERQPPSPQLPGGHAELPDKDARTGVLAPTTRQRSAADEVTVRWNRHGTPASVTSTGPLADGLSGGPEKVARTYLAGHQDLFGLDADAVAALEKVAVNPIGDGAAVLLRQRFGELPAGYDGLVAIGVKGDEVVSVTSTLSRHGDAPASATLSEDDAVAAAGRDAGITVSADGTRRARLVAVPTPEGARSAYQVTLMDASGAVPTAVTSYVDARSGKILVRENLVDHDSDNPRWSVFPAAPPGDYSSRDTRRTWCFKPAWGCRSVVGGAPSTGLPWDADPETGASTNTSLGNAARAYDNRSSDSPFTVGTRTSAPQPDREYDYRWANQWYRSKCDPATLDSPQEADLEAAMSNLFVQHNRMHNWSYRLGFTESAWNMQVDNGDRGGLDGDPEQGNAQAGARFASIRDNANQITPPDGVAPITNMYLWQPIAGAFYPPCVDGDFDMTVIGHEYSHAISQRMIAGPDAGWSGPQAGAMNESTSDLLAMEYLSEYGFRPPGRTPYVTGAYVTGEPNSGIRNYDMSRSPLNYSDLGYDLVGTQVHADGEVWSATQFELREAFVRRYGDGNSRLQRKCADGRVPVDRCPGNRRWAQLTFDALLLMASGAVSYVDHRDALLAADTMRFGGKNHELMWKVFARNGLGETAASDGPADADPEPSFASPMSRDARISLKPRGDAKGEAVRLYVGDYEARAVPVADTDPATRLDDTFDITPGRYAFVAVSPGFGHKKFTTTISTWRRSLSVWMHRNLAASANGATAAGDGQSHNALLDGTEATNWQSVEAPVAGRQVTVDLAGDRPVRVGRVQVSAMLRPSVWDDPEPIGAGQNRFTALRAFELLACDSTRADCSEDASYRTVYTSPSDAFPADRPRPTAPDINLRSFNMRDVRATHLRLEVVSSQCTGAPAYAGEQDNDPRSSTDCGTAGPWAGLVRAAELQAFAR